MANYRGIVEKYIGRKLKYGEVVHHINTRRRDNSPDNLYIFGNQRQHEAFHALADAGHIEWTVLKSNLDKFKAIEDKKKKELFNLVQFKYSKETLTECIQELRPKMEDQYPWEEAKDEGDKV